MQCLNQTTHRVSDSFWHLAFFRRLATSVNVVSFIYFQHLSFSADGEVLRRRILQHTIYEKKNIYKVESNSTVKCNCV